MLEKEQQPEMKSHIVINFDVTNEDDNQVIPVYQAKPGASDIIAKHEAYGAIKKRTLISENMKLLAIKRSIEAHQIQEPRDRLDNERFLRIVRYLGHQYDIPGSA